LTPLLLGCSIAHASDRAHDNSHAFAGLEAGSVFLSPNGHHTGRRFTNVSANLGNFAVASGTNGFNVGAFAGYEIDTNRSWLSAYRVDLEATQTLAKMSVRGHWDYTLHEPANHYRYRYSLGIHYQY